jgi:hypothetical protein
MINCRGGYVIMVGVGRDNQQKVERPKSALQLEPAVVYRQVGVGFCDRTVSEKLMVGPGQAYAGRR